MDILTGKLANLSHDKLQQMLANVGDDNNTITSTPTDASKRMTDADVVQAHMASGSVEDSLKSSGMKHPSYG
jgi:hypothetical protein